MAFLRCYPEGTNTVFRLIIHSVAFFDQLLYRHPADQRNWSHLPTGHHSFLHTYCDKSRPRLYLSQALKGFFPKVILFFSVFIADADDMNDISKTSATRQKIILHFTTAVLRTDDLNIPFFCIIFSLLILYLK